MVRWVRPETPASPAKPVKGPVPGENPVRVISAEIPMWGAPALLSNTMLPPSMHAGEHAAFNVGVIDTQIRRRWPRRRGQVPHLAPVRPRQAPACRPIGISPLSWSPPACLILFFKAHHAGGGQVNLVKDHHTPWTLASTHATSPSHSRAATLPEAARGSRSSRSHTALADDGTAWPAPSAATEPSGARNPALK